MFVVHTHTQHKYRYTNTQTYRHLLTLACINIDRHPYGIHEVMSKVYLCLRMCSARARWYVRIFTQSVSPPPLLPNIEI